MHDLRHTFASHLIVDSRLDDAQMRRIFGHARRTHTRTCFDRAAHTADIRERIAANTVGGLLTADAPSWSLLSEG